MFLGNDSGAVRRRGPLITAGGYELLSTYPMEESWLWKRQPRDRSRLTSSDSGSPVPFISRATRCPL